MLFTTIGYIPHKEIIEHYGLVCGSTVRAKNLFKDMGAGLKNLVGGELKSYTELLEEARREALGRMEAQAGLLGANAIINVRFATSNIAQGASELYVYGTAVKI